MITRKLNYVRNLFQCRRNAHTESKNNYDVVIIGAGHNGLVAAAYLQKSGLQVCVLERRPVVGGAAVTEEIIPGFKFSRASYVLSLLRSEIYKDLELKRHGLKIHFRNPSSYTPLREEYFHSNDAKSLTLGDEKDFNFRNLSKFSKKDAEAYESYEKQLGRFVDAIEPLLNLSPEGVEQFLNANLWNKLKVLRQFPAMTDSAFSLLSLGKDIPAFYELMTAPIAKIMSKWFESEPLKATLATDAVIGSLSGPYTPGSGYVLLHHVMGELEGKKGAWGYPEGGMGAVTQAMARSAESYGAHIYTNKPVESIVCNGSGRATGVVTSDGEEIKGKAILSNATAKVTYLDLLPARSLPPDFETAIKNIDYTSPVTKINVAVSRIPNFTADPCREEGQPMPHHQCTIHLNCEKMELIDAAFKDGKEGRVSSRPLIEMVIPSALDPTIAPKGCHVCLLFTQYTPYLLPGGRTWDADAKEQYAQKVFNNIEEYAPGFKESVVGKEVLSPPDLENIFGLTGGNIFHGAMSLDQLFLCRQAGRMGTQNPIRGLYLCGSGSHPGGGVMGAPGRLAAKMVLHNWRKL